MTNELFVFVLSVFTAIFLWWGFKTLPGEKWQFIGTVPISRDNSGQWKGINFTYYGFFSAVAYVAAITMLFLLMGSMGVTFTGVLSIVVVLLLVCVPASKLMAKLVEKKQHTFTIGGASFVGIVFAPWTVLLVNHTLGLWLHFYIPFIPAMAAFSISYAFGEGLGRLACISFGCCYGKPLSKSHPFIRRLFNNYSFIFYGKTKKAVYEGGLEGVKVVPIQAITSILYVSAGLASTFLFLKSYYVTAFLLALVFTQIWRFVSELFRRDYRGSGNISVYQILSLVSVAYSLGIVYYFRHWPLMLLTDIKTGFISLWNPAFIFFFLILWVVIFVYTGKSSVTRSSLIFDIYRERI